VARKRWWWAFLALIAVVLAPVSPGAAEVVPAPSACPPAQSAPASPAPPSSSPAGSALPAPEQIIVCVGSQAITAATYAHWLMIAEKSSGPPVKGHPPPTAAELRKEVLGFLISSDWVTGEAHRLRIRVSAAEARGRFYAIRRQQFPKHAEFERFLRESGQTVADLMFRVELNLLSSRIQRHILADHHTARSQQRALSRFLRTFKSTWRRQTYCVSPYISDDCGHVQSAL
jgi:hypothetical protein